MLPQIPWRFVRDNATIVSEEGTTIASVGGDLKLQELSAAGEFLAHCASVLPVLVEQADQFLREIEGMPSETRDGISCEAWNNFRDAIKEARAEHLAGRFPQHLVEQMEKERTEFRDILCNLVEAIGKMPKGGGNQVTPEVQAYLQQARVATGLIQIDPMDEIRSLTRDLTLTSVQRLEAIQAIIEEQKMKAVGLVR